jgi:hypothetical protein
MAPDENNDFLSQMMSAQPADTAPDEPEAVETDETPEVVTEVETPVAETTSASTEKDHVPLAALMAERDKRKEAARKAEDLEKRIKELEAQTAKPAAQLPDFYQDPERYVQIVVAQANAQAKDAMYAALEEAEREKHENFDEVFAEIYEKASKNPELAREILTSKNPAAKAYKLGKELREIAESRQDPEAYRAKIEAEVRAKVMKEVELENLKKEKAAADAKALADSIPPDLSSERSAVSSPRSRKTSSVIDELFPKT